MYGIQLDVNNGLQDFQEEFRGLNRNIRRSAGEFFDMKNMTTDNFPTLSPRKKRGLISPSEFGMTNANNVTAVKECFDKKVAYIRDNTLHIWNFSLETEDSFQLSATTSDRKMLYLGGKLIIFPDMLQVTKNNKLYKSKGIVVSAFNQESKYYIRLNLIGVGTDDLKIGDKVRLNLSDNYPSDRTKQHNYIDFLFKENGETVPQEIVNKENGRIIIDITGRENEVPSGYADIYSDTLYSYFSGGRIYISDGENEIISNNYKYDYLEKKVVPYGFDVKLCEADGTMLSFVSQPDAPSNHSYYWYDTTNETLKGWSSSMESWVPVTSIFIKITLYDETGASIEPPFEKGECVVFDFFKNLNIETSMTTTADVQKLIREIFYTKENKNMYYSVKEVSNIYTVFGADISIVDKINKLIFCGKITNSGSPIGNMGTVIPKLDYICEGANRLWGCRYGTDYKGDFVNEIYCSGLGNFSAWYNYEGASTDSFAVSLGDDGEFRGCVFMNGRPSFFKENSIFTIYGEYPANYQLVTLNAKGIQKGSEKSLALCSDGVLYKGVDGIYMFDGSSVQLTSSVLGIDKFYKAVGAMYEYKYYVSMQDKNGVYNMFVLDLNTGYWTKEDNTKIKLFFECWSMLMFISSNNQIFSVEEGKTEVSHTVENDFEWECQTGIFGYSQAENKYLGRFNFRMSLSDKARVSLYIQYDDSDEWELQGSMKGKGLQSFNVPVIPHRCDHFNIKIKGKGEVKIFSIGKTVYQGGSGI